MKTKPRAREPVQHIEVGENPTECIYDGTRTLMDWRTYYATGTRYETCPKCGQKYHVEDEDTPDDDA